MDPLQLSVHRSIDFGTVSLIGIADGTGIPLTIQFDHRLIAAFWRGWQSGCTLSLDRAPELDGEAPAHG